MLRLCFLALLFILSSNILGQQQGRKFLKIEYQGYIGQLIIHKDDMAGMRVDYPYTGHELRIGLQTTGNKYWQQLYKYPTYGLGFYSGHFNNTIIGNPKALFAFLELPFIRKEKYYWNTALGFGLSFNFNEYDEVKNKENLAIGSDVNVYVDFITSWKYKLTNNIDLGVGIKLQHFSNGATKHPNSGLNMVSGLMSASYTFGEDNSNFFTQEKEKYKLYEYSIMYGLSKSALSLDRNTTYYSSVISTAAHRRMNDKHTLGLGMDIFHNNFLVEYDDIDENAPNSQLTSYAIFASSEMILDKLRLSLQLGAYLWKPTNYNLPVYERVAVRYYFLNEHLFTNISIKAHGFKAQVIEWGIGINI